MHLIYDFSHCPSQNDSIHKLYTKYTQSQYAATLNFLCDKSNTAQTAAIRDAQRERDEARVKRTMLIESIREIEAGWSGQGRILEQVSQWRGLIGQADFAFKRDVLDALDVRVVLIDDEAGGRVVEVATALSLPRRFAYLAARRYKRLLWG